jgi:hypothetical protein
MTRDQMATCIALGCDGFCGVNLPRGAETPVPGLILLTDTRHTKLLMVQGDGSTIDLLAVHRLAEDCVRNWQKGSKLPGFVGDFKRLTPLAEALNGMPPAPTQRSAP